VEELTKLAALIDAGKLRVFVHRVFPLAETQEALAYKPPADAEGKVVVMVG
jgi:NADPH:quinone reductase-like Zn-dependent oxidoreductase